MKELVQFIARSLVDDPTEVQVTERVRGNWVDISLAVAEEDMGRMIGRKGRVVNAMRALVRVAAAREGKRANLEINAHWV